MNLDEKMLETIADSILTIFPSLMKNIFKKDEFTEKYGLGPRYMHILHLLDDFGPMPICEISKRLSVSAPNMTPLIDKLISEGYVFRVQSEKDRRFYNVELTQKGKDLLLLHTKWLTENLKLKLEKLTDDEIEEIAYILKRLKNLVFKMIE